MNKNITKIYSYRVNEFWKNNKLNNYKYLIEDAAPEYVELMCEYLERDLNGEDITKIQDTEITSKVWKELSRDLIFYFNLTENFIFRYRYNLNWDCVCAWQNLSEKFIDAMEDFINWDIILENQKLSEKFIRTHTYLFDEDNLHYLSLNTKIQFSESFMREYKEFFNWISLCDKQHFTLNFIREMKNRIRLGHFNWTLGQMIDKEKCKNEFKHVSEIAFNIKNPNSTLGDVL